MTLSLWRVSVTIDESMRHTGVTSLLVLTAPVKAATTTQHTRAYDAEHFVLFRPFITITFRAVLATAGGAVRACHRPSAMLPLSLSALADVSTCRYWGSAVLTVYTGLQTATRPNSVVITCQ